MKSFLAALFALTFAIVLGNQTPAVAKSKPHSSQAEDDDTDFYGNPAEMNAAWSDKAKACEAKEYEMKEDDCRALISIAQEATGNGLCYGTDQKWAKCKGSGPGFWMKQVTITHAMCNGHYHEACYPRTWAMIKVQSLGYCWGHEGQIEADKKWERCSRKSLRIQENNDWE